MGQSSTKELSKDEIEKFSTESGFKPNQITTLYKRFQALDKDDDGYLRKSDFLRIQKLSINPICEQVINVFFHGSKIRPNRPLSECGIIQSFCATHEPSCDNVITISVPQSSLRHTNYPEPSSCEPALDSSHPSCEDDSELLDFRKFITMLAIFRPYSKKNKNCREQQTNSRSEKLRFVFDCYDRHNQGYITSSDVMYMLSKITKDKVGERDMELICSNVMKETANVALKSMTGGENISQCSHPQIHAQNSMNDAYDPNKITFEIFEQVLEQVDVDQKLSVRMI